MSSRTVQVNFKLDEEVKKKAEAIAKRLGLSLSGALRMLTMQFICTESMTLDLSDPNDVDPDLRLEIELPDDATGKEVAQAFVKQKGYDEKRSKKMGEAYDDMLQSEKNGTLVDWKDI